MKKLALFLIAALSFNSLSAQFNDDKYLSPVWISSTGLNVGGSNGRFQIGAETSIFKFEPDYISWKGFYADVLYSNEAFSYSVGPEAGFLIFGCDAGFQQKFYSDEIQSSLRVRLMINLSIIHFYYSRVIPIKAYQYNEFGVLLKYHFPVSELKKTPGRQALLRF